MSKTDLLDRMKSVLHLGEADSKRASQILDAIEGMSVWEAKELLERCIGALQLLDVSYKES